MNIGGDKVKLNWRYSAFTYRGTGEAKLTPEMVTTWLDELSEMGFETFQVVFHQDCSSCTAYTRKAH